MAATTGPGATGRGATGPDLGTTGTGPGTTGKGAAVGVPSGPPTPGGRATGLLVALLAVFGLGKLAALATTPPDGLLTSLISDDAYYYLLPALNLAKGAGSTFDGVSPTNGYQPLWFWLLTAAFGVGGVTARPTAIVVTVVVLAVLWFVAAGLIVLLARRVTGVVPMLAGLVVHLPNARWWTGCENALAAVVVLGVVVVLLRGEVLVRRPPPRVAWGLGVLLAVLCLCRLDMAVLVGLLAAVGLVVWGGSWRERLPAVLAVLVPSVLTLLVHAGANQLAFGIPVPVSGVAKQLGPVGRNFSVVADYLLFGAIGPVPLFSGALTVGLGAAAVVVLRRARPATLPDPLRARSRELARLIVVLVAAQFVQVLYYAVFSTWELQAWYFTLGSVSLLLSTAVLGGRLVAAAGARRVAAGATVLVALVLLALLGTDVARTRAPLAEVPLPARYDPGIGRWIDANLPSGARLAMGDQAGGLAFATRRPVVQLEGLVNSVAYLDALRSGTVPQFLARAGVTHVVRYVRPGEDPSTCVLVEPFFGLGPKATLDLCGRPPVYVAPLGTQASIVVWAVPR